MEFRMVLCSHLGHLALSGLRSEIADGGRPQC